MTLDLTGRTALVCGASGGIGRATALALAARGCAIVALARRADRLEALLPELIAAGAPSARALVADLDDGPALSAAVAGLDAQILVHNTGGPPAGPLLEATPDQIAHALQRHVGSAQRLAGALVPAMEAAGYGRIVVVTSTSVREPIENLGVSNLTRAAMASWAKTLARELPPGITVNNVMPGYTDTERLRSLIAATAARTECEPEDVVAGWEDSVPEARFAAAEEPAGVIAFLCSPAAGYIRGVSLPVDGGRLRSI